MSPVTRIGWSQSGQRGVPRSGQSGVASVPPAHRETHSLKTTRDYLNIIDAYRELGSYRAAALLCGTTDKTVRRVVERHEAGGPWRRRPRLPTTRNTDPALSVLAKKVKDTKRRSAHSRPTRWRQFDDRYRTGAGTRLGGWPPPAQALHRGFRPGRRR
jgi:hypothetical protein